MSVQGYKFRQEEDIVLIVSVTKYDLNRGNKY